MASKGDNLQSAGDQSSCVDNSSPVDPELDAILDSALEDFDKVREPIHKVVDGDTLINAASDTTKDGKSAQGSEKQQHKPEESFPEDASYDFLADAMSKQFEESFSALLKDPNLKKQFEELADSAENAASNNNAAAFADTVEKALSGLNLNAENLQGDPSQQELWEHLAESFGADATGGGSSGMEEGLGAMGGMFQNMVKQLLSKELLYQPLKEVSEKYKDYLEKNKQTLSSEQMITYRKQMEIIEKVVEHLDGDSDQHSEEEKNARFETLLDLLQKMHELGNPPTEVVGEGNMMMPNFGDLGDMGQFPGMGGLGNAQDPSQCSVM